MKLDEYSGQVSILQWSNKKGDQDPLLAVECQENQVFVWKINKKLLVCRLQVSDGE